MESINWNGKLKEALDRTEFMALGTVSGDKAWVNPVAFSYSEKLEIYFISMLSSKHSQNILANPNVSCAIYKTERFTTGDVVGLQMSGVASHVTDQDDIRAAAKYYFSRGGTNDEFLEKTAVSKGITATWQFFKVVPTEVWCFDSRVFGEERIAVPFGTLDLIPT